MTKNILNICLLVLLAPTVNAELPKSLVFGATDWCPYTCEHQGPNAKSGIVEIYLTEVFKQLGVNIEIKVLPWRRAVRDAEQGRLNGLLTVVPGEAKHVLLTSTPTMNYLDCFYTRLEDDWEYKNPKSLEKRVVGAVQDYGYGDKIDQFLLSSNNALLLNGDMLIKRMQSLLLSKRIDTFISEKRVHELEIRKAGKSTKDVRVAGCLQEYPLYIAVQPDQAWSQSLVDQLNKALANPANHALLKKVEQRFFKD